MTAQGEHRAARSPALVGVRRAAGVAVDARAVRGRHVPARVPGDRRASSACLAIALQQTLSVYMFAYAFMMLWHGALSDSLGRRPVVLGGARRVRARHARLRDRRQHRVAVAVARPAGTVRGHRPGRRPRDHSRPFPRPRGAADDVADDARVRPRSRARAHRRRRACSTSSDGAPSSGRMFAWTVAMFVLCVRALPETLPAANRHPLRPRALWRNYREVLGRPASRCSRSCRRSTSARSSSISPPRPRFWSTGSACRRGDSRGCSCR